MAESRSTSSNSLAVGGAEKLSSAQAAFISQTKEEALNRGKNGLPVPIVYDPPQPYDGRGLPRVQDFYLKRVLICAPHLNFPSHSILCSICKTHPMNPVGWGPNDRFLHGLSTGAYLCQYRYRCSNQENLCAAAKNNTTILSAAMNSKDGQKIMTHPRGRE